MGGLQEVTLAHFFLGSACVIHHMGSSPYGSIPCEFPLQFSFKQKGGLHGLIRESLVHTNCDNLTVSSCWNPTQSCNSSCSSNLYLLKFLVKLEGCEASGHFVIYCGGRHDMGHWCDELAPVAHT